MTASSITRRTALGAFGAAALGYAVFGPRTLRDVPSGRVVLDYWDKWTGHEGAAMEAVVDEFNASQDRIFVRYFAISGIEQKAMVAIAGGGPPDILGLWDFSIPAFSESGAILPIDRLWEAYGSDIRKTMPNPDPRTPDLLAPERFAAPALRLVEYGGLRWGAHTSCSSMAMYYNRALFREHGLDPSRPPRTIAELDEASQHLDAFDANGEVRRAGFLQREPGWWDWIWGYFFGERLLSPDGRIATANAPRNVRAYQWVRSYPERLGATRLLQFKSGFGGYNSVQQPLLAERVAMCLHGPYLASVIGTFRPDFDYAAAAFPVEESLYDPDRPMALIESDILCVPTGSAHPREAMEFVAYTQRQAALESIARIHAKPTPLVDVSPDFVRTHPNRWIALHNRLLHSDRAFPKPVTRIWPQYEAEFITHMGSLWSLDETAAEALDAINARGQTALDAEADRAARRYGGVPLVERAPRVEGQG